jgi:hypothetical protein
MRLRTLVMVLVCVSGFAGGIFLRPLATPLTVAAQRGTSIAMIKKAYLRFIPSAMQEKLSALKG